MKEKKNQTHSGISFCEALALVFIVLKLCGVIHWNWLLVLAPLWIPAMLIAVIALIIVWIDHR